jgi:hypothetical protein
MSKTNRIPIDGGGLRTWVSLVSLGSLPVPIGSHANWVTPRARGSRQRRSSVSRAVSRRGTRVIGGFRWVFRPPADAARGHWRASGHN